jgi:hypothetical protein
VGSVRFRAIRGPADLRGGTIFVCGTIFGVGGVIDRAAVTAWAACSTLVQQGHG